MTEPYMLARTSDPDTSKDAAAIAALSPSSAKIKGAIMHLLREHGPKTAFELRSLYDDARRNGADWPDCQPNTINRRVSDLAGIGLVVDMKRRRPTPDGRKAIVWRPVNATERAILTTRYGLGALVDLEHVEIDWQKVSDVRRLRARIAELEHTVRGLVTAGTKLQRELDEARRALEEES
jgi:hypothetical protein